MPTSAAGHQSFWDFTRQLNHATHLAALHPIITVQNTRRCNGSMAEVPNAPPSVQTTAIASATSGSAGTSFSSRAHFAKRRARFAK